MKTPIITLACAAMASFAFLACEDTGTNPAPPPNVGCKIVASPKISTAEGVFINPEVEEWVEDQISSGKNDKMDIVVFDMQLGTRGAPEPTVSCWGNSSGEGECTVNGEKMSLEEYNEFMDKYEREYPLTYRQLTLSGEVILSGGMRHLLLTASEVEDLAQRYTEIAFEFYTEPVPGYEPGDITAPPPPIAGPSEDTGGPRCP